MKIRAIIGLIICAAFIWVGCAKDESGTEEVTGPSGTQKSGNLTGVLSAANSPYWITDDIIVPANESLTIEPGVELRFDGLHKFVVQGHLEAVGTPDANIVFTSMEGALGNGDLGQWRSIVFDTGSEVSEMAFCIVKYAAIWDSSERYPEYPDTSQLTGRWLNGAIFVLDCSPFIRNCTILQNQYHAIYCLGSESYPYVLNNNFYQNDGDGIRCEDNADADIWYNNSRENAGLPFGPRTDDIGELTQLNSNRDSCDFQFNIRLEPDFEDWLNQNYTLLSTSALISAGLDTLNSNGHIGSIPYYIGATELRGPIGGTVITAAASPWYVTNNIFIDPDDTLITEDGALVLFDGIYNLRLAGTFQFEGTTFISSDSTNPNARWEGIIITEEADENSYIQNCRFVNSTTTTKFEHPFGGTLTIYGVSPEITGNTIIGSQFVAISCQNGAAPQISGNYIEGFGPMGILCFNNSHPYIQQNVVTGGSGYTILCEANSSPTIESNLLYSTSFIGIKCEENASPAIEYNTIIDHDYSGIQINNQSNPTICNNIIAFNGTETTWNSGDEAGKAEAELPDSINGELIIYDEFTLEFDIYRRFPSTDQQISIVGLTEDPSADGVSLKVNRSTEISLCWDGTELASEAIASFDARWQHVRMQREAGGLWTVIWDEGGANETTLTGQDEIVDFQELYCRVAGEPYVNTAHFDNFEMTVGADPIWQDGFDDGINPPWELTAGIAENPSIAGEFCFLVKGDDLYGNGIDVEDEYSSWPTVTYNDVYQPSGQGTALGGFSPDNTNIALDPLFLDLENGDLHLQSNSPCLEASSTGEEIGAYGLGDW